ncbi:hypothetical protein K438DRAFT_412064 [Mycena galopus ATCC 62051]|nr:hypothetical protein K438DRAFT_412064 [Mycena galopus ATCC 62051]
MPWLLTVMPPPFSSLFQVRDPVDLLLRTRAIIRKKGAFTVISGRENTGRLD